MISPQKTTLRDLILLVFSFAVIIGCCIYYRPFNTPDAMSWIETAREMVANHNWLTPTLNQVIDLNHPPLFYWLTGFSIRLFGLHPWSTRLFSALFGLLALIVFYLFSKTVASQRQARLSAVILVTHLGFLSLILSATPYFMSVVLMSFTVMILFLIQREEKRPHQLHWSTLFWVLSACNMLLIGLSALFLPLFILLGYSLFAEHRQLYRHVFSVRGLSVFMMILLPWFYLAQKANPHFLYFYFYQSIVLTIQQGITNPLQTLMWLILGSFIAFLPWSILLNFAFWATKFNKKTNRPHDQLSSFLLVWLSVTAFCLIPLLAFHLVSYWMLCLLSPPLIFLTAKGLDQHWSPGRPEVKKNIQQLILILLMLLIATFCFFAYFHHALPLGFHYSFDFKGALNTLFFAYLVTGLASYTAFRWTKTLTWPLVCLSLGGLISNILLICLLPTLQQRDISPILKQIKQQAGSSAVIATAGGYFPEVAIGLAKSPLIAIDWQNMPLYGSTYQSVQNWVVSDTFFWQTMASNGRDLFLIVPTASLNSLEGTVNTHGLHLSIQTPTLSLFTRQGSMTPKDATP